MLNLFQHLNFYRESYIKSQNILNFGHPEFISGSDIQCMVILKQVQDDWG